MFTIKGKFRNNFRKYSYVLAMYVQKTYMLLKKLSCLLESFPFCLEDVSSFLDFWGDVTYKGA